MRILVTGANGFIGSRLVEALLTRGHLVIRGLRRPGPQDMGIDFERDLRPEVWIPRLQGIEVVINAVGVARGKMGPVHDAAPRALFEACARAGVKKVVQISALGADEQANTRFHLSKRSADDSLTSLPLEWVVVLPSLVVGRGGVSTGLFSAMAALPIVGLPGNGNQQLQPIAVDDLARGVAALVDSDLSCVRLAAVGPEPMSVRELVALLAGWLGFKVPPMVPIPLPLVRWVARLGDYVGNAPVTSEMLKMLARGNTAEVGPWAAACGFSPRPLEQALDASSQGDRYYARLYFVRPLLRYSVAFIWLATALICSFFYPLADSYELLAACHIGPKLAPLALYGACALDALLGVCLLLGWFTRPLLLIQLLLISGYSLVILWALPHFWLHPFGPMTKNIPLMGAILALWAVED